MNVVELSDADVTTLLTRHEGHFVDFKSARIAPAKASQIFSALGNAEGGEVYIGIEDAKSDGERWHGFANEEAANAHLAVLTNLFPDGEAFQYKFLRSNGKRGLILYCEVIKNQNVWPDTLGDLYLRKGAQSLRQDTYDKQERLRLNKGLISFEDHKTDYLIDQLAESASYQRFVREIVPATNPKQWLIQQRVTKDDFSTVAGLILFADEPQTVLPKAAIKISRYRTSEEPTRATLDGQPVTIEGCLVDQIKQAVDYIVGIVEKIPVLKETGLKVIQYPRDAIHEIVTNAVIHRDYSLNDDVHIRIFDNRIEIYSPGPLPGHITVANILDERFARNQKIVRLANKFPDAPNKDVGEGLNTAFEAMRQLQLRDPVVTQENADVLVTLRHEKLAEPAQAIIAFLRDNAEINNARARAITFIGSENKVKNIFRKMMDADIIERIPGRSQVKTGYRPGSKFPEQ